MKRIFAILLSAIMLLSLAACGNGDNKTETPDQSTSQNSENETTAPETTAANKDEKKEFEKIELANNEYFSLTINNVYSGDEGYTIKAAIANNSADTDYCYSLEDCAINGVSVDTFFYSEVKAGKKAVEEIILYDDLLAENGITEYTDVEMVFTVQEDILEEPIATETLHYYPLGQDKAVKYERQANDTDVVLIDNEYITVTATGMKHDEEWECQSLCIYIENKTDEEITLSAESTSINDIMIDPLYADIIPSGGSKFSSVDWEDYELEEKEIEQIDEIEIEFKGYGEIDYNDIIGDIDLEDLFGEDGTLDDIISGDFDGSLFEQTVVYKP